MPSLDQIRRALSAHAPEVVPDASARRAAVAMCLCELNGAAEVLFIERARREGDPWSGHMAFPGGRVDRGDLSPRRAAERETFEEVGLLLAGCEPLGRLDDLRGHHAAAHPALVISGFVYRVEKPPPLVLSDEVEQAFWFPLAELLDPGRRVEYRFGPDSAGRYPGILVGVPERHVVWGLTYRFLEVFFAAVGRPLPERPVYLPPEWRALASRDERAALRDPHDQQLPRRRRRAHARRAARAARAPLPQRAPRRRERRGHGRPRRARDPHRDRLPHPPRPRGRRRRPPSRRRAAGAPPDRRPRRGRGDPRPALPRRRGGSRAGPRGRRRRADDARRGGRARYGPLRGVRGAPARARGAASAPRPDALLGREGPHGLGGVAAAARPRRERGRRDRALPALERAPARGEREAAREPARGARSGVVPPLPRGARRVRPRGACRRRRALR